MACKRCYFHPRVRTHLFALPRDSELRDKWLEFIFKSVPEDYNPHLKLCAAHFTENNFLNFNQFNAGFAQRLQLKDGVVPSLCGESVVYEPQPTTSRNLPTSLPMPSIQHTACQTIPRHGVSTGVQANPLKSSVGSQCTFSPTQRTVATQFSFSKQTGHVQSKGTQVDLSVKTETNQVDTWNCPSTPIEVSTSEEKPPKLPRLEFLKEEEEEKNISDFPKPQDSTFGPGVSTIEFSETSSTATSDNAEAKYIVFEHSLRELFETCPMCKHNCDVQRPQFGTLMSFNQVCSNCKYSKKWQSQPVKGRTPVGNLLLFTFPV